MSQYHNFSKKENERIRQENAEKGTGKERQGNKLVYISCSNGNVFP